MASSAFCLAVSHQTAAVRCDVARRSALDAIEALTKRSCSGAKSLKRCDAKACSAQAATSRWAHLAGCRAARVVQCECLQLGNLVCAQVVQDLKAVRDEAADLYVELQAALLRASVKHYLTSDGTLWDSVPLRRELRDATYDLAFALVLILNQVTTHAPPAVQPVRHHRLPEVAVTIAATVSM